MIDEFTIGIIQFAICHIAGADAQDAGDLAAAQVEPDLVDTAGLGADRGPLGGKVRLGGKDCRGADFLCACEIYLPAGIAAIHLGLADRIPAVKFVTLPLDDGETVQKAIAAGGNHTDTAIFINKDVLFLSQHRASDNFAALISPNAFNGAAIGEEVDTEALLLGLWVRFRGGGTVRNDHMEGVAANHHPIFITRNSIRVIY